jgi:hypothetical protein
MRRPFRHRLVVIAAIAAGAWSARAAQVPQNEISGTVVTASAPQTPIARVLVTISGGPLKTSRTVITDDQGGFVFADLPPGAFIVVAARPPYVKTAYGAKRPGRPGTPVNVAAGQRVTGVTIPLARGAAITGTVRGSSGETARGVRVDVTSLDTQAGATPEVTTDDRGVYRAFGLPPGRYLVSAGATELAVTQLTQFSDEQMDEILARLQRRSAGVAPAATPGNSTRPVQTRPEPAPPPTFGYVPIYYPGTPDPEQATTIALEDGEERAGVDIGLQLVRTAAIAGHVSIGNGALPAGTQVTITRLGLKGNQPWISPPNMRSVDAAGNFKFTGFMPGRYRVTARATSMTPAAPAPPPSAARTASIAPATYTLAGVFWAITDITIGDADVSGLELLLQPGLRMSGRIAFDGGTPSSPIMPLRLVEVTGSTNVPPSGAGRADGTFEILNIMPGTYTAASAGGGSDWSLRSVVVGGRDILDAPIEIGTAGDVTGVIATFSNQHTELSGRLQSAPNVPAPEYFVVVFSPDRAVWRLGARRVQFTRPGTDGRFSFRDLPAGDYLIAALTDMEPTDLGDASFLERLIPGAVPIHLNEGEKKTQDLKLVK